MTYLPYHETGTFGNVCLAKFMIILHECAVLTGHSSESIWHWFYGQTKILCKEVQAELEVIKLVAEHEMCVTIENSNTNNGWNIFMLRTIEQEIKIKAAYRY